MATQKRRDYKAAAEERSARERGRSIPHYAGKVAKNLALPRGGGRATPPKKASS